MVTATQSPAGQAVVAGGASPWRQAAWRQARGWLWPGLCVIGPVDAVLGLILAYHQARQSTGPAHFAVFWLALAVGLAPLVVAGLGRHRRSGTVMLLLLALGGLTFVPKLLMSLHGPVYYDEYGHWRQVVDLVRTGNPSAPNSFLPIIEHYPGLAMVTAAVHEVLQVPLWASAVAVVAVAHCASVLLVYGIARALDLSTRASCFAAVVFSLNPSFMFFDTEYSYESLGITLLLLTLWAVVRARRSGSVGHALRWSALGLVSAAACTVTHHVSAVILVGVCAVAAATVPAAAGGDDRATRAARWGPVAVAGWSAAFLVSWIGLEAPSTVSYIWPHLSSGLTDLLTVVGLEHAQTLVVVGGRVEVLAPTTRTAFAGGGVPAYELLCGYLAPVAALGATAAGAWTVWRRRAEVPVRTHATFVLLALAYFASLPLALTAGGGEAAHRSWAFSYIGVALVGAVAVDGFRLAADGRPARRLARWRWVVPWVVGLGLAVALVGNVATGEDVAYRFPGPYEFGSDTRSVTPELQALARWCDRHLPAGSDVVTDRFTGEVIEGDTRLDVPSPAEYEVYKLYLFGDAPPPLVLAALRAGRFRYFILDTRIEYLLPQNELFEGYEGPLSVSPAALRAMHDNGFATLIHRTAHFEVFALDPEE